ncbi:hypothetical protein DFP72DRAFT_874913 [Ephemerocybe angulata]|uniref:F-box domain-containing protein n=1 Tax=Ephemerocybe angulata TaxID=980116 RepID=A0A8H6MG52_9AGAR|nr:hypothetical protein DFP72DRAFT_874913 [Tulosesus angulatus]
MPNCRDTLDPLLAEAKLVQDEIGVVTNAIAQQQERLRTLADRHRYLTSPLRKLTAEVLERIFKAALELPSEKSRKSVLINFCLVCKTWKAVAYATPALWTPLVLSLPSSARMTPREYDTLVFWLSRSPKTSRGLTIISSRLEHQHKAETCSLLDPLVAKLLKEGPVLDHLHLHMMRIQCLHSLLDLVGPPESRSARRAPRPWDSLKTLGLTFRRFNVPADSPSDLNDILLRIPQVRTFELNLPYRWLAKATHCIIIPTGTSYFSDLTTLTLACDWGPRIPLAILDACVNLETLTVDMLGNDHDSFVQTAKKESRRISLAKVCFLRLRQLHPSNISILEILDLPSLCELDVSIRKPRAFGDSQDQWDIPPGFYEHVKTLYARSGPYLRRLRIRGGIIPEDEWHLLHQLLLYMSRLTHLTLDEVEFSSSLLKELASGNGQTLPCLAVLELFQLPLHLSPLLVYAFLDQRRVINAASLLDPRPDPLKQVALSYRKDIKGPYLQVLDGVRRVFMEIYGIDVSLATETWRRNNPLTLTIASVRSLSPLFLDCTQELSEMSAER